MENFNHFQWKPSIQIKSQVIHGSEAINCCWYLGNAWVSLCIYSVYYIVLCSWFMYVSVLCPFFYTCNAICLHIFRDRVLKHTCIVINVHYYFKNYWTKIHLKIIFTKMWSPNFDLTTRIIHRSTILIQMLKYITSFIS